MVLVGLLLAAGGVALLVTSPMALGELIAEVWVADSGGPAPTRGDWATALTGAVWRVVLAWGAIQFGLGLAARRRWAAPLLRSVVSLWLVFGLVVMAQHVVRLLAGEDPLIHVGAWQWWSARLPTPELAESMRWAMIVSILVVWLGAPLVLLLFLSQPEIQQTAVQADPHPHWAARTRGSVRTAWMLIVLLAGGAAWLAVLGVFTAFGWVGSGLPGRVAAAGVAVAALGIAPGVRRQLFRAWVAALGLVTLVGVGVIVSLAQQRWRELVHRIGVDDLTLAVMWDDPAYQRAPMVVIASALLMLAIALFWVARPRRLPDDAPAPRPLRELEAEHGEPSAREDDPQRVAPDPLL